MPEVSSEDLLLRQECRTQALNEFWSCWSSEYLRNLPPSTGSPISKGDIRVGSVVMVHVDTCPRLQWPWGVVVTVFPGKDGKVRAAEVRTAKGIVRRPVQKLYNLEINDRVSDLVQAGDPDQDQSLGDKTPGRECLVNDPVSNIADDLVDIKPMIDETPADAIRTRVGRVIRRPRKFDL